MSRRADAQTQMQRQRQTSTPTQHATRHERTTTRRHTKNEGIHASNTTNTRTNERVKVRRVCCVCEEGRRTRPKRVCVSNDNRAHTQTNTQSTHASSKQSSSTFQASLEQAETAEDRLQHNASKAGQAHTQAGTQKTMQSKARTYLHGSRNADQSVKQRELARRGGSSRGRSSGGR